VAKRSRNLSDADIKVILGLLDGWRGRLSWSELIIATERRLGCRYTRQALHKHARIQNAFALQKRTLVDDSGPRPPTTIQMLRDRIARLDAENRRVEAENDRLLEQFARWAYNASTRNIEFDDLDRPLPPVQRSARHERRGS
jgi:hypothetical protein